MRLAAKFRPVLTREEVGEIRATLSGIKHSIEAFQSLSAHLDHIMGDVVRLDHHMLAALARFDKSNPLPKAKKKKCCKRDQHVWGHVGTRTDSAVRCKKCDVWG